MDGHSNHCNANRQASGRQRCRADRWLPAQPFRLSAWFRRFSADRSGVTAIQFAILVPLLMAFAAFAVEVTSMLLVQKRMQTAADAAIASASNMALSAGNRLAVARAVAAANGQINGVDGVAVSFVQPPTTGDYVGNPDAQAVIITRPFIPQLLRIFQTTPIVLRAQAVATVGGRLPGCILALATSGRAITTSGQIVNSSCQLMANSTADDALNIAGGSIAGDVYLAGGAIGDLTAVAGKLSTYGEPNPDPYADYVFPTPPACPNSNPSSVSGTRTLNPGRYCNGLTIANNARITFNPGVYFIDTRFIAGNNAVLTATGTSGIGGVTIILNNFTDAVSSANFELRNNVQWSINAPNQGATAGIAFEARPGLTGNFQFNNGAVITVNGAIYMPELNVTFQNNARTAATSCTQLIANTITITSTVNFRAECPGTAVRRIGTMRALLAE